MNWKLLLKSAAVIGFLLIPLNIFYWNISIYLFHGAASPKDIILFVGLSLLAAVSIFRFIYRRTEKHKVVQAVATILLSEMLSFFLTLLTILILLNSRW